MQYHYKRLNSDEYDSTTANTNDLNCQTFEYQNTGNSYTSANQQQFDNSFATYKIPTISTERSLSPVGISGTSGPIWRQNAASCNSRMNDLQQQDKFDLSKNGISPAAKMHAAIPYQRLHQPEFGRNRFRCADYAFCFFIVMLLLIFFTGFAVIFYEIYYMSDEQVAASRRIRRGFPFAPMGMADFYGVDAGTYEDETNEYKDLIQDAQDNE